MNRERNNIRLNGHYSVDIKVIISASRSFNGRCVKICLKVKSGVVIIVDYSRDYTVVNSV